MSDQATDKAAIDFALSMKKKHEDMIAGIDSGVSKHRKMVDGVLVDANEEMRAKLVDELIKCKQVLGEIVGASANCDVCFAPHPCPHDNPIAAAARAIRTLHVENIALIDSGHIFTRDGVDVSGEIRALSAEQIILCDTIIRQSPILVLTSEEQKISIASVVTEIEEVRAKRAAADEQLPEIGNYGHEKS